MKTAVVTDSNSGITQKEGEALGIFVLPMPFMIDGETYEEDISLTQDEFYGRLKEDADISTSQPSPETVMNLWNRILEDYDEIIHIPMSSGLSSSCQTALMLAEDYDGRVQVADNHRISITQRQAVLDAKIMAEGNMAAEEIRKELERTAAESSIYITIDTLKYLKRGGRVTPAAAALGTLLRIKPVLQIQGDKLDAFSKARTMKQAKSTMLAAIAQDLKNRFGDPEAEHTWIAVAHTCNEEAAREFVSELKELYPKTGEIIANPLSLSVACHIGPGALAVAVTRCLSGEREDRA
ncbi:MAG: DegV family protein [Lachnospiraceae bacterium]|nr:DegV family protein [Lachnospiraceae bacterium]